MGTTIIHLEEDFRARVAAAAERVGKTADAFILDAIVRTVELSESESEFQRNAEERWAELRKIGKSVAFAEAREYLEARAVGRRPARPSARKLTG
ncbi:MAG: CopG family transcriptional regulator [Thauera sp.]